ncbi:MAG: ribonuclease PH [Anaerolineales bacterium]|jgi:ribonuclease PH
MRIDQRQADEIRPVTLSPNYVIYPEGSVLIAMGQTKVLCNVTIENEVPRWMKSQGKVGGWVTAEYALLPRSTHTRTSRETHGLGGRTQEIRRLIGRSLRAAVNLELLGERTCIIDCDVLQADGGTRTAAITGGYVSLALALQKLIAAGEIPLEVLAKPVAAISVGILRGEPLLDLCYAEDSTAEVDFNVVMNAAGEFIELQGTAEGATFSRQMLETMMDLAHKGIKELLLIQKTVLG